MSKTSNWPAAASASSSKSRAAGWLATLAAAAWLPAAALAQEPAAPAQPSPAERVRQLLALPTARSLSGRFTASGEDPATVQWTVGWAEDTADALQRQALTNLCLDGRAIHFALRREDPPNPRIAIEQVPEGGAVRQRLTIYNLESVNREDADEALVFLLLDGCVRARAAPSPRAAGAAAPRGVPQWLARGVAQNLLAGLRARNARRVVGEWSGGGLGTAPGLLAWAAPMPDVLPSGAGAPPDAVARDRAIGGVFVARLLADAPGRDALAGLLDRLAAGGELSAEVASRAFCAAAPADFDAAWDEWVLRQRRVVFDPGRPTVEGLERLRALLLLYTGDSGIPFREARRHERLTPADLVAQRKADWMPAFCEGKCAALRLAAVGRGERIGAVTEAYVRFFDALRRKRRAGELERLLREADRALADLEKELDAHASDRSTDARRTN